MGNIEDLFQKAAVLVNRDSKKLRYGERPEAKAPAGFVSPDSDGTGAITRLSRQAAHKSSVDQNGFPSLRCDSFSCIRVANVEITRVRAGMLEVMCG